MSCHLVLSFLFAFSLAQKENIKPLVFEFDKGDPQRVRIHWDPTVDVKKIKDVSSRDVHYVINNATGKVREEYSPWLSLVTEQDDVDPTRRLLFVKSDMCIEQDYRVSWYDGNDVLHENAVQRMEPSPEPWKPSAKIEITNLRYDSATKRIIGSLGWSVSDEKLKGVPKLGSLHPSVRLDSCRTLFDKPIPLPVVDPATKAVSFDPQYAKHECSFYARLRQMTYNGELECRSLRQTTDDESDRLEMSCDQNNLNYASCRDGDEEQPCAMTCDQLITATGEFDWSRGWPKPYVKIDWKPRRSSKPVISHTVRYSQVDSAYNNYPVEEFNVTFVELNATASSIRLEPFSKDNETFYAIQICSLHETCFATAKWSTAPKYAVRATSIIEQLPQPPSSSIPAINNDNGRADNATSDKNERRPLRSTNENPIGVRARLDDNTPRPHSKANAYHANLWALSVITFLCLIRVCVF